MVEHLEGERSWQEWEAAAAAAGEAVASLKKDKAEKEQVDAAVAELLHRKAQLIKALEAAMAGLDPSREEYAALKAKMPPPPKPSKKDKKNATEDAAAKEASQKAALDAKMAARAKKAEASKAKPSQNAAAAARSPAAAAPAPEAAKAARQEKPPTPAQPTVQRATGRTGASNKGFELHYTKEATPLLAILMARLAKQEVALKRVTASGGSATLIFPYGRVTLSGDDVIARYFARVPAPSSGLYGPVKEGGAVDALAAAQIDEWVERAKAIAASTGTALSEHLRTLNLHLRMRAAVAGHALSLADAAVWISLRSASADARLIGAAGPHVLRWWKFVEGVGAMVSVAQDFFGVAKDAGSMEIPLPDAEFGKVVTRFPPEPSGHLHIGHIKAAMLNAHFAEQYQGKMLLRFDDTNPSKEKEEYEEAILRDLASMKIVPHKVSHTSDRFDELIRMATGMLESGIAFIDPSPQEEQQALRMKKLPSPFRDQSVEENLRLWKEMQAATAEGLKCCMRAKIDPSSDNGALRDPTIYRCNLTPHHATKDKYKVYPTYDLCCPIVDSMEGVTHALRDRQYSDRDAQYRWFLDALKLRKVHLWGFSRINFVRTLLSKRKLQWLINEGRVDGWNDPRFPTVAGILRRGMTVEGLKTFILSMGASKNTNLMGWDKIWATNKAVIDSVAHRYSALLADGLVPVTLSGAPAEPFAQSIFAHPKDESLGKKIRIFAPTVLLQADDAHSVEEGEEVTLMSWGNAIVRKVHRAADGKVVSIDGELHLAGSVKSTKKKLTWLADTPELVDVELVDYDFLLTKDKIEPEDEDKIESILNNETRFIDAARGEAALRQLQKGQIIQVERRGFYICDRPFIRSGEPISLVYVPEGKNMMGVKR